MKRIRPIIRETKSGKSDSIGRIRIDINYERLSHISEVLPTINAVIEVFDFSLGIAAERIENESKAERPSLPLLDVSDEDAEDMVLRYYIDNHQEETIYVGDVSDELNLPFHQVEKIVDKHIEEGIIGVKEE